MYAAVYIPGIPPSASVRLPQVARAFAPEFEAVSAEAVVFSVAGLRRLIGGTEAVASAIAKHAHELGLDGRVALARTRDLALLAVQTKAGVTILSPQEERTWLAGIPLEKLPLPEETISLLALWGIRNLEEFCALPETGVLDRLGHQACLLHRLARGESNAPLAIAREAETYRERVALDHPVDNLEPLLFLLNRVLEDFCRRLEQSMMAATAVALECELEGPRESGLNYRIELPVPLRDAKYLLKLLQLKMEGAPPPAAVVAFTLRLEPVAPRVVQHHLYEPTRPEPGKLDLTLTKIRAFVGEDRVGTPALRNSYRPDAWTLAPMPNVGSGVMGGVGVGAGGQESGGRAWGLAFRFFRPALRARVTLSQEVVGARGTGGIGRAPASLVAEGIRGEVQECAGPWIQSGEWWAGEAWERREWDVLLASGVYRIYCNREQAWFVEGSYD